MNLQTRLRVSVLALFIEETEVLMIHQMTPPEPNCWDLPGGGVEPEETLLEALHREVEEETGIVNFEVLKLLTIAESFFAEPEDKLLHSLNIIYLCRVNPKQVEFNTSDPEIGSLGIQWLSIKELSPKQCSTRSWIALTAMGLVDNH